MVWYHSLLIKVLKVGKIPKSVAIIMDGNRRYATQKNKEKHEGHNFGLKKLEEAMQWCLELGVKELTVFALSTDNLKRSQVEVDTLMRLARDSFTKMTEKEGFMDKNGIQVKILGDLDMLPEDVAKAMRTSMERTKHHDRARLNVCLCYNSKYEILQAVENLSEKHAKGQLKLSKDGDITVEDFEKELYGGYNCKPDILIRTSNEVRLSNFLLYQTDDS